MAADAGGARFVKEESKLVMPGKLKESEISMLFILAIVAVAALGLYFFLYPMFTNMNSLTDEVDSLQATKYEYQNQIAQTEIFKEQYEEAKANYNKYFLFFHSPMDPEIIDERITGMLIAHEMTPASLTMTTLQVEGIPPYVAQELRANPVPDVSEPEAPVPPLQAGDPENGDAAAANEGEPAVGDGAAEGAENAVEPDCYAFVYTIDVSAYGDRNNLYTFLAQVATMTAMHVISFDFTDQTSTKGSDGKTTVTPGEINMQIKMYVLIDGVSARDYIAGAQ